MNSISTNVLLIIVNCHAVFSSNRLALAIDGFAIDFFKHQLASKPNDNVVFSPLSINQAYNPVVIGAKGRTQKEMIKTLHIDGREMDSELKSELENLSSYSKNGQNKSLELGLLVALAKSIKIKPDFEKMLNDIRAVVLRENFGEREKVQEKINSWVANKTKNKIPKMLSEPPEENTIAMILNTVYFQGKWEIAFDPKKTEKKKFLNSDGSTSTIPMMNRNDQHNNSLIFPFLWVREEKIQIIEIPFTYSVSMYIFLTDKKRKPKDLVAKLNARKIDNYTKSMKPVELDYITIPKFKMEQEYDLSNILPAMGMPTAFSKSADFSGIADGEFFISKSIHKSVVEIDENGAVASSGTSVQVSIRQVPVIFNVDHPFMFMIKEKRKSLTVFAGIINKL